MGLHTVTFSLWRTLSSLEFLFYVLVTLYYQEQLLQIMAKQLSYAVHVAASFLYYHAS
jgi:hypothetical protein